MQIKSILAAAAIALAATVGSASAADQFATLDGISAKALSSAELAAVQGAALTGRIVGPGSSSRIRTVNEAAVTGGGTLTITVGDGVAFDDVVRPSP